ncbi:MAG: DUF1311 domain-containing protein [Magnetococcales bacterium]|uniref:DUF1311 domain-containing protein n=1 Tax=Candidatus Magnetobacterium casense TaxID=1455061 RepID=A0ABS6RVX1_9BACT|nr:lysozyme inhibitor LprI family protein [Candidatus Magnetobacterium casensis]MBF0607258.1 DUF1311 domain-containing protein [Nitrospirota bacterium]MBV6340736.1 DUF1311 domain-containing protein [Candidatus Magnetobacterium casensis]
MRRFGSVFVVMCVLSLAIVLESWADCINPKGDEEVRLCISNDLVDSDKRINQVYQELMKLLDTGAQESLRKQQRAWLKTRDAQCKLDSKESDRQKWLQKIMADRQKTLCVVRFTNKRVNELEAYKADVKSMPPPSDAYEASANKADYYDIVSKKSHNKGKWYFEVKYNRARIAKKEGNVVLNITARSPELYTGFTVYIRRKEVYDDSYANVGIGVDLDNGKVYVRENGKWIATPGSAQGMDIKLGREYIGKIDSSAELNELVEDKSIVVNFGTAQFDYSMPDGYLPFVSK